MSLLVTLQISKGQPRLLADADELPTLSNEAGTAGVIRQDTGAIVVAAGAAFTRVGVGQYVYELIDLVAGVSYVAYRRVKLDGITQVNPQTLVASPIELLPSYLGLNEADTLAAAVGGLIAYVSKAPSQRVQLLAMATMRVDAAHVWQGRKCHPDQLLEFPRIPYNDSRVWDLVGGSVVVPIKVKFAVLLEANSIAVGERDRIAGAIDAGLTGISTGSLSEQFKQAGAGSINRLCRDGDAFVARYVLHTGSFR